MIVKIHGVNYGTSRAYVKKKATRRVGTLRLLFFGMFWYILGLLLIILFLSIPMVL